MANQFLLRMTLQIINTTVIYWMNVASHALMISILSSIFIYHTHPPKIPWYIPGTWKPQHYLSANPTPVPLLLPPSPPSCLSGPQFNPPGLITMPAPGRMRLQNRPFSSALRKRSNTWTLWVAHRCLWMKNRGKDDSGDAAKHDRSTMLHVLMSPFRELNDSPA